MARKYVYGIYPTVIEAEEAVAYILNQGVPRNSVAVVGNVEHAYHGEADFIVYEALLDDQADNRGFFARIFDWSNDANDSDEFVDVDFKQYKDSLDRDELLVLIDQVYEERIPLFNSAAVNDNDDTETIEKPKMKERDIEVTPEEMAYSDEELMNVGLDAETTSSPFADADFPYSDEELMNEGTLDSLDSETAYDERTFLRHDETIEPNDMDDAL
ncbi:hypothetical protein [Fundicoccus culcitae]|uniref:Uncharacterized protein n=1 Tax=Fundicoccus culcitae TaxID=2969821 RepID=A0ABY5P9X9_9LACT|nr:hypothetical protein [Fundicoccus culcitae]UUX35416.1 hypothetical protein NRE15_07165 [Fundicoccus culcitae]